jgi:hypothetical protein
MRLSILIRSALSYKFRQILSRRKPEEETIEELSEIASNYLYKDVLQFERLKRPDLLFNLLKALALQIGGEVSFQELSRLL